MKTTIDWIPWEEGDPTPPCYAPLLISRVGVPLSMEGCVKANGDWERPGGEIIERKYIRAYAYMPDAYVPTEAIEEGQIRISDLNVEVMVVSECQDVYRKGSHWNCTVKCSDLELVDSPIMRIEDTTLLKWPVVRVLGKEG